MNYTACCEWLEYFINLKCDVHDHFCKKSTLIIYNPKFNEYTLPLLDGSGIELNYCPFCGLELPKSKRDLWFDHMEKLGIDPWQNSDQIHSEYLTEEWWKNLENKGT